MYNAVYIDADAEETTKDFAERLVAIKKHIPNQRVWGLFNYLQVEAASDATAEHIHNRLTDIMRIRGRA